MGAHIRDENIWQKAKAQAAKEGHAENYAYITHIYKKMGGTFKRGSSMKKAERLYEYLMKSVGSHKYVSKKRGAQGQWIYTYAQPQSAPSGSRMSSGTDGEKDYSKMSLRELDRERMRLYSQAFKLIPHSPRQEAVNQKILKIESLKKNPKAASESIFRPESKSKVPDDRKRREEPSPASSEHPAVTFVPTSPTVFARSRDTFVPAPFRLFVTAYSPEEYTQKQVRTFLADDGKSGFGLTPDGDLISVFSGVPGRLDSIMKTAIAQGAKTLDCLGFALADKYAKYGFQVDHVEPWNDEYAPPGWDYDKHDHPPVVYMKHESVIQKGANIMAKGKVLSEAEGRKLWNKMNPAQRKTFEEYADFLDGSGTAASNDNSVKKALQKALQKAQAAKYVRRWRKGNRWVYEYADTAKKQSHSQKQGEEEHATGGEKGKHGAVSEPQSAYGNSEVKLLSPNEVLHEGKVRKITRKYYNEADDLMGVLDNGKHVLLRIALAAKPIVLDAGMPALLKTKLEDTAHKTPPKEYREEGATERSDYADSKNYKYPLHTEANVRAALSYFAKPKNHNMYSPEERKKIARKILSAARKYKIEVSDDWREKFGLKKAATDLYTLLKAHYRKP